MSYYRQGPHRPSGSGIGIGVPPLTPCVKAIIIACGSVWLLQFVLFRFFRLGLEPLLGVVPQKALSLWLWQPVTYMFLHSLDLRDFHLIFNLLMLWMFGGDVENVFGTRQFIVYYLVCGAGAGLLVAIFQPGLGIPTVGASGAIFGLFMAYGMIFSIASYRISSGKLP